jgi:DNA repair protein RadC
MSVPKKDTYSSANLNAGHRQRLRERFLNGGISALSAHEVIELLLTYSIPQKDVKPLAKMLLNRFGDINGVLHAPAESLMEQSGIKENSAALFKLVRSLHEYLLEIPFNSCDLINSPLAAIRYLRDKIASENHEVLSLIFLDNSNRALGCEWHPGKNNRVTFYPQAIARSILLHRASGVIVVHNHPNGICRPSEADLRATRILKNYLNQLDLKLIDHLLITKTTHLSLLNRIGCVFKNYVESTFDPEHIPSEPESRVENLPEKFE